MNAINPDAPTIPVPKIADVMAHLTALFPPAFVHPFTDALIEIAYGKPGGKPDRAELFSAFRLDEAADFAVSKNLRECNVYVGPTLKKGATAPFARTRDTDFLAGLWSWTDHDAEGDFERARSSAIDVNLGPGIIVNTGTIPHTRAHAYFKIAGGVTDSEHLRSINRAVQKCLGGDLVQAPSHVMRLAGTVNYPTPAKVSRGYVVETVTVRVQRSPQEHSVATLSDLRPSGATNAGTRKKSSLGFDIPRDDEELFALLDASRTPGKWHNSMRDAIATMIGRGWTDSAIRLSCAPYCDGGAEDPDMLLLISSGPKSGTNQASHGRSPVVQAAIIESVSQST